MPPKSVPICAVYCVHDDDTFLEQSIAALKGADVDVIAAVNQIAWNGSVGHPERLRKKLNALGISVFEGSWPTEELHRAAALEEARRRGYDFMLIPDSDEIIEAQLLESLVSIAEQDLADVVRCTFDTYWKSPEYIIRPRETIRPVMLVNLKSASYLRCREYVGPRDLYLNAEYGVVHHLSYCGSDERIGRKIATWGHKDEVVDNWFQRVFKGWEADRTMRNLHPTHPPAYGWTERIHPPEILGGIQLEDRKPVEPLIKRWPSVSVVIPLYGGPDDIDRCLTSLQPSMDLLHEVIVVDDLSPDDAATVAERFVGDKVKLLRNEENRGFAGTCNRGYAESTGQIVIFLNSDTIVPRAGLIRLIDSLMASGSIGASGPYTNNCGYDQQLTPTYTSLDNLDLFAEDFAEREVEDKDLPMLVGFCLAVRRSVLEEVGIFDERFGRGLFEDNDLCYRILRAGYKLKLASKSYIHHRGSQSINRNLEHPTVLLERNRRLFNEKWAEEIQSGFASHLPGQSGELIRFNEDLRPDKIQKRISEMTKLADISLCMIARDEERVIADCLRSVQGIFKEIIFVDTGSIDRTKEIAAEFGAKVFEMEWPESFAAARNESLKHATGKWIFWMDADDTLPQTTAIKILEAAIHSPKEILGYIVPVQFVEGGVGGGTRVDHVKLFVNRPEHRFEGRIHEQILPALRAAGGEIARIKGVVFHSGYDTSPEGQAKKRIRDEKLLKLDLEDRPDHPFLLFNLGMTDHFCQRHEEAIDWLEKSIANSGPIESQLRKSFALLGVSYRELGHPEEALWQFQRGLDAVGNDPELYFHRGMTLTSLGRLEEAKESYLRVGGDPDEYFSSFDVGILGFKKFYNLGHVCFSLGQYREGCEYMREAIATGAPEAAEALLQAAMEREDFKTAVEALDHLRNLVGPSIRWAELKMNVARVRGDDLETAAHRLIQESPNSIGPRLMLARLLLEQGRVYEAEPVLDILDQMGSAEGVFFRGISAIRRGDTRTALFLMQRAHSIDPNHEQTVQQIEALKRMLAQEEGQQ